MIPQPKGYAAFILFPHLKMVPQLTKDFSIINIANSAVVAQYDGDAIPPRIVYYANERVAKEYANVFEHIVKRSVRLDPCEEPDLGIVWHEVFGEYALSPLDKRPIEMSAYISIEKYDTHEEKHAYYVDMMEAMLREFHENYPSEEVGCRVLELGAGTGIFTKRLSKSHIVSELVALEIDWVCYKRAYDRFEHDEHVKIYNEDSRKFNPSGRFHAAFSAFADHHIKLKDKADYLHNVRKNLTPGGLFIVGDEFLRAYDPDNQEDRRCAIKAYHDHIIERAEREEEFGLADLERAAMESGLAEVGDFKLSCQEYERYLRDAGFDFRKQRIGPIEEDVSKRVGGVYVYVAWDGRHS